MEPITAISAGIGAAQGLNTMFNPDAPYATAYKWGQAEADAQDKRTRKLYQDLYSPKAMVGQYEDAGLSTGLMMGKGGNAGGAVVTGAQAHSQLNPKTSVSGAEMMQNAASLGALGIQGQKMEAEINLLNAQARNLNTEADKREGVDTELAQTSISAMLAEIGLKGEQMENMRLQNQGQKLDNDFQTIVNAVKEATAPSEIREAQARVEDFTYRWELIARQVENMQADTETKNRLREGQLQVLRAQSTQMLASAGLLNAEAVMQKIENQYGDAKVREELHVMRSQGSNYDAQAALAKMQELGILTAEERINLEKRGQNTRLIGDVLKSVVQAVGLAKGLGGIPADAPEGKQWTTTTTGY